MPESSPGRSEGRYRRPPHMRHLLEHNITTTEGVFHDRFVGAVSPYALSFLEFIEQKHASELQPEVEDFVPYTFTNIRNGTAGQPIRTKQIIPEITASRISSFDGKRVHPLSSVKHKVLSVRTVKDEIPEELTEPTDQFKDELRSGLLRARQYAKSLYGNGPTGSVQKTTVPTEWYQCSSPQEAIAFWRNEVEPTKEVVAELPVVHDQVMLDATVGEESVELHHTIQSTPPAIKRSHRLRRVYVARKYHQLRKPKPTRRKLIGILKVLKVYLDFKYRVHTRIQRLLNDTALVHCEPNFRSPSGIGSH